MSSITIITIVVVALLTVIVFGLVWLAYASCLKTYRIEVENGKHDKTIHDQYHVKSKPKASDVIGGIVSYVVLAALVALFVTGVVYRIKGDNFSVGDQTALVIKSGSMSGFYDDALAEEYYTYNYDASLQFSVGDVCFLDTVPVDEELVKGEVYGYKRKNIIITHRLVAEYEGGLYEFRGDNNPTTDGVLISRDRIVYHYTGNKVPGVGAFILYAQSYFGIWSLAGMAGIAVSSEVAHRIMASVDRTRYCDLYPDSDLARKQRDKAGGKKHEK